MLSPADFRRAVVLTGPTGSGKSALALRLAEEMGGEIVAMDSMTPYRGMDVGTAKPTPAERARVPHHLIDVLDPWESANVAWWLDRAAAAVRDIESRGRVAFIVGGTPLYLKALLRGLFDGPPRDAALRARLEAEEPAALFTRLAAVDPASARRLHVNDVRRVVRALEVWELTGRPISDWQTEWANPSPLSRLGGEGAGGEGASEATLTPGPSPAEPGEGSKTMPPPAKPAEGRPLVLCLDRPRDELYARIDRRVLAMLDAGWLDEARRLRELPRPPSREAAGALGYRELFDYLDGVSDLPAAVRLIQQRTRNFAKRQLTWFRHLNECESIGGELTSDSLRSRMN